MKKEIWKDIPNYEGLYQCSNFGKIKTLACKYASKELRDRSFILKGDADKDGYLKYRLYKKGKHHKFFGHRLVLLTFIGESDLLCNHKNGIKNCNHLENLEYCTQKENSRHMREVLGINPGDKIRGELQYGSKLKEGDVEIIYKMWSEGFTQVEIAKKFNIHKGVPCYILNGKRWNHLHERFKNKYPKLS